MERVEMPEIFKMVFAEQLGRENEMTRDDVYSYCDILASMNRIYTTTPYNNRVIYYYGTLWATVIDVDRVRTTKSWDKTFPFRTKRSRCYQNMIALLQEMQWSYTITNRYIDGHYCVVIEPSMTRV
jgi:hypothetical protein